MKDAQEGVAAPQKKAPDKKRFDPGWVAKTWVSKELSQETGGGRAAAAKTRRCESVTDALTLPSTNVLFHMLYRDLEQDETFRSEAQHRKALERMRFQADRIAAIACVLAWVRTDTKKSLAQIMGTPPKKGGSALVAPMRLQKLIRIDEPMELVTPLRRLIQQVDRKANTSRLANDIWRWGPHEAGQRVRSRWCLEYYDHLSENLPPLPLRDEEAA